MRTDSPPSGSRSAGFLPAIATISALLAFLLPLLAPRERGPITEMLQLAFTTLFLGATGALLWKQARASDQRARRKTAAIAFATLALTPLSLALPGQGLYPLLWLALGASYALSTVAAPFSLRPILAGIASVTALRTLDELTLFTARAADGIRDLARWLPTGHNGAHELVGWTGRSVDAWIGSVAIAIVAGFAHRGVRRWVLLIAVPVLAGVITLRPLERGGDEVVKLSLMLALLSLAAWPSMPTRAVFRPRVRLALAASLIALLASGLGFLLPVDPAARPKSALILEGAFSREVPSVDNPTTPKGASMGGFFQWLDGAMERTTYVDQVTTDSLREHDLLVMVNLSRQLQDAEIDAIDQWVRSGGRLLFLGDHTDIFGVMRFSNPLIERFGIGLKFDSAIPLKTTWANVLDARWSPMSAALTSTDLIRISVGATLSVASPARPLVVARAGFADRGDRKNPQRAFLGNWTYDEGHEAMGDLVLAADAKVGSGHVVALGDTAFFQETSFSQSWTFVDGVLRHLSQSQRSPTRSVIAGLLIAAVLGFVVYAAGSGAGLLIILTLLATMVGARVKTEQDMRSSRLRPSSIAWIHTGRGSNTETVTTKMNEVSGFATALVAAGHSTLLHPEDQLPELSDKDVFIKPSGAAPLRASEVAALSAFCERGGQVLAFVGPGEDCPDSLLKKQGFRVINEPAGTCPGAEAIEGLALPTFRSAWTLDVSTTAVPHRVLVRAFERPVVVEIPMGRGRWIWISDPQFPWDKNFKTSKTGYQAKNFLFLNHLLHGNS